MVRWDVADSEAADCGVEADKTPESTAGRYGAASQTSPSLPTI